MEDVLLNAVWPGRWPYGFEDFRPLDYQLDDVFNTQAQYIYSQSLLKSDYATLLPGLLRVPISRHFVYPKDKLAMIDHLSQFITQNNVSVLEIFSTYESILPANIRYDAVVGVGWDKREMKANALLDDFIAQDVSTDPFLPLADNYFDFVVMPANFQLLQKPRELMQEVNRVLKPGGTAFVGVKLALWSFLGWKQGRYYMETNYLEDILAAGSFFHYAEGFTKPQAFDLTLPELNIVGQIKDVLFPQPRLDFYAVVQARKRKDSPHGKDTVFVTDPEVIARGNEVRGEQFQPRVLPGGSGLEERFGPYY